MYGERARQQLRGTLRRLLPYGIHPCARWTKPDRFHERGHGVLRSADLKQDFPAPLVLHPTAQLQSPRLFAREPAKSHPLDASDNAEPPDLRHEFS
jgi:hypothetical protein